MVIVRIVSVLIIFTVFFGTAPDRAWAEEWVPLSALVQAFEINGVETKAVFHPLLKTTVEDGRLKADLKIRADLSDLKRIAPSLVLWRKPIDILSTALILKGHDLRPDPPGVVAEGLLFLDGTGEQTRVRARLVPEIIANSIRLRAEPIGRLENGILKSALNILGFGEGGLNPLVYLLNRYFSEEEARLRFPPELLRFDPVFKSVAFSDPGDGGLNLELNAALDMKPEELPYLLNYLAHPGE